MYWIVADHKASGDIFQDPVVEFADFFVDW
jgi:hypothetical protein